MNSKTKGVLQILLVVILIAAFGFVAYRGVGSNHRGSAKNIRLGLDLKGGVSVTYEATEANPNPTDEQMEDTIYKMQKRVETMSTEASVYQEGSNRVTIDIPGVSNSAEILETLGKAGSLQFVMYNNLTDKDGNASPDEGEEVKFDEKNIELDGKGIEDAKATQQTSETGISENVVIVTFTGKGSKTFSTLTGNHVGEQLAIVYDNKLVSAPVINSKIDGECVISGGEDFKDMKNVQELASTLRIGDRKSVV